MLVLFIRIELATSEATGIDANKAPVHDRTHSGHAAISTPARNPQTILGADLSDGSLLGARLIELDGKPFQLGREPRVSS